MVVQRTSFLCTAYQDEKKVVGAVCEEPSEPTASAEFPIKVQTAPINRPYTYGFKRHVQCEVKASESTFRWHIISLQ